jgi:fumarate reductase subunit D
MFKKTIITISSIILPIGVFAQFNASTARSLFDSARELINERLIPLFVALALMYTIYSVVQFIAAQDDTQKREEKKQQIFWGIIGLFVITSIWGLVAVVGNSFGLFAGGTLLGR